MKLVFFKNEGSDEIKLKLNHEGKDEDFNYVRLIEFLHNNNKLEETEYPTDILSDEKDKIDGMITKINNVVVKFFQNED